MNGFELLERISELGARGLGLDEACRALSELLVKELGVTGVAFAARSEPTQPWLVHPASPTLAASLGVRSLAQPGSVAPVGNHLAIGLAVPPPMQAVLLWPERADAQLVKPFVGAIALGMALGMQRYVTQQHDRTMTHLARKLRAMQQVSHQITNSYDLRELSSAICAVASQALGAQYAGLFHLDNGTLRLVEDLAVLKPKGLSLLKVLQEANQQEEYPFMGPEDVGFLLDVVRDGKPCAIADLAEAPDRIPLAIRRHGLGAALAVPLVTQREILGVFLIGTQEPHTFDEREQELLQELAQQASGAFVTSKLYAQTVEEKRRADHLVGRLRDLNAALAAIGRDLNVGAAMEALLAQVPRFVSLASAAVYLEDEELWSWAAGDRSWPETVPGTWRQILAHSDHVASVLLEADASGGRWIFPFGRHDEMGGGLALALAEPMEATAREALETLVGHAALTLSNAANVEQVGREAITDGLTGVFNRRHFDERLDNELQRAQRFGHPISLIIMDLDYFKKTNDLLGHLGGDTVLKELAGLLKEKVRKVDLVARYGGEEFAVILPETSLEAALYVAEKLRGWIEEFPFTDQEKLPHKVITASLGVGCFPENARGMEDLIAVADEALYQAKQAGRNRVGQVPSPAR